MVERLDASRLSETLKAAADPTRRAILTALAQEGATRVTDLAAGFDMSLNAVSKHIKVLEASGLVQRRTVGRVHLIELDPAPLKDVEAWFAELKNIWELRLDRLTSLLEEKSEDE